MSANSILAVGSIAIDWLELPDGQKGEVIGGSATYFTLAASRFAPVHVVGIVGNDFPKKGLEIYKKYAANLDDLQIVAGKTFRWGGRYHDDWENRTTLYTELGVFESFRPTLHPNNKNCRYIFLGNIQPLLQLEVLKQINSSSTVITDTMNLWIEIAKKDLEVVLQQTDVFLLNDSETVLLSGISDPVGAAKKIQELGPETVVVKQGKKGALLVDKNEVVHVDVFPISKVVDPTGAGDSFAGGFVGALASGESMIDSLITGTAVASFCVEGFGIEGLENISLEGIFHREKVIRKRSKLP